MSPTATTLDKSHLAPVWTHLIEAPTVRGRGAEIFDADGNRRLDFTCGIGVTNTGHCHSKVVKAIQAQAEELIFAQINCTPSQVAVDLSHLLNEVTPANIDTFFFDSAGAQAVEGAIKLAKVATKRTNVIALQGGFHGRTHLTMALTASKTVYRALYQPLVSGIFYAPFPYSHRYGWGDDETVDFCIRELKHVLKAQTSPAETAAIILEPVLGEGGYVPAPPRYFEELRKICDEHGILLIMDEIQSGFGRTGRWWAHTRADIQVDILTMAKGIASGMPISAIGASRALMEKWPAGAHGGTYSGGNAIVMAGAIATIQAIRDENLCENAAERGDQLTKSLCELQKKHATLSDVRGWGLMIATEFRRDRAPVPEIAAKVVAEAKARGLLLLACGTEGNIIRWIPPLVVTAAQIDEAVGIFGEALAAAGA